MPRLLALGSLIMLGFAALGCVSTAPDTRSERDILVEDAQLTADRFKRTDPTLADAFFADSVGYAVFPTVGKGGLIVGGAYGKGVLFEDGRAVGFCDLTQASVGAQIGGQAYSEIIFFQDEKALRSFKLGTFEFAAQASAVAAAAGAGANAKYDEGVAVFTMGEKGAMLEASIGGQRFDYVPGR